MGPILIGWASLQMQRLEPNGPPAGGEEKIFLEMPLISLSLFQDS
ncbi:hypothetical protein CEV34_4682 [Brucella pseudogrignonensis]|uniref:Uncharacterized protein n=1 Tax=Brucella pseudogrignonensis TaxID=419475 RepID=A0A256G5C8_9HYPH|nr:hypothetical protein CEV34_4682 [Brucella pseudogrignonensis]